MTIIKLMEGSHPQLEVNRMDPRVNETSTTPDPTPKTSSLVLAVSSQAAKNLILNQMPDF